MDHDEFARRAEALRARLYRTAYLYLGSEADALEAVDEGVYQALRALRTAASAGLFRDLAHPDRAECVPPGAAAPAAPRPGRRLCRRAPVRMPMTPCP